MVSNSLTLESWKFRNLRPELESLINFGSFFAFWGHNQLIRSYFCLSITSNRSFQANIRAFLLFPSKNCGIFCHFWTSIAKMWLNYPAKLVKFCFTTLYFSVSGIREWDGEIKYAFESNHGQSCIIYIRVSFF